VGNSTQKFPLSGLADRALAARVHEVADGIVSAVREGYESLGATTYVRRCDRELEAVQFHLTSVYAKLGIHSRTELAATRAART